ncbi:beta-glucosidase [Ilumatobacter sp.]|uniref:beta-glucosidase n=1 Tax=Ilumatobacter sp. TaxID=1967498 RepID=UPI003B52649C
MSEIRRQIGELPLEAQIELLSGRDFWSTPPVPDLGIPSMTLADGPHGIRRQRGDADHLGIGDSVPATCFPTASCLAASWDVDLLREVGVALGREARAAGVGVLLGPGMNIKRHPAGGRDFEYLSEDPWLSGNLAAAYVEGVQSEGVAACPKHLVANNHETYRMVSDVIVDERTLREIYLRGFEIVVRTARPWAIMTSYNLVNGTYTSDDERLVGEILRGEWGHDGLVVTDWGAVNDRVAAVRAGTDLEMPSSGGAHDGLVADAVDDGELDPTAVTDCATRVAELARRTHDEARRRRDGGVGGDGGVDEVAHHRLARRAAAAGSVLLTNDGTLPLDPGTDVAIIGAFADTPRYQGAGSSQVVPTRLDVARRSLEDALTGRVRSTPGYDAGTGEATTEQIRQATDLAREAEVPIVFVGLPASHEAEGIDRGDLALPRSHDDLVSAVCAANPRTVVVLCNGAPVMISWADRPAAILEAYLGGQAGGSAIADVLLGRSEPGGRLAESFPASMVFPSEENFGERSRQVQYREGLHVGYRFHTTAAVAARFAFGHGLSYTTFEWDEPRLEGSGTDLTVSVTVRNTGERPGSDLVQLYVRDVVSSVHRPERELAGFAKVHLEPGDAETVTMALDERSFASYDVDEARWRVEEGEFDLIVARSSADERSTLTVEVPGEMIQRAPRGARGPGRDRFVATTAEFESMLGHPVPPVTPVLPFTINTVVEELDATRLGRIAERAFRAIARRQMEAMLGADPDPVLVRLSERMISEAPLRFLVSMSGGSGSLAAFEGLTTLLSTLRITGRRS